jgi:hypothetical protein
MAAVNFASHGVENQGDDASILVVEAQMQRRQTSFFSSI